MSETTCKLCGEIIYQPKQAWREVIGWVSPKGAKAMTGAQQTHHYAHPSCISLLRSGVAVRQETLI